MKAKEGRWKRRQRGPSDLSFHSPPLLRCAPGFLGETCQFPDPCQDAQLCQNGGSCQALLPALPGSPSLPSPLAPSFSCTCPSGFTGQRCQAQLKDPCSSFCSKMGRCHIQASGRPRCSCLPGWTGEHCSGGEDGTGRNTGLGSGVGKMELESAKQPPPLRTDAVRINKPSC